MACFQKQFFSILIASLGFAATIFCADNNDDYLLSMQFPQARQRKQITTTNEKPENTTDNLRAFKKQKTLMAALLLDLERQKKSIVADYWSERKEQKKARRKASVPVHPIQRKSVCEKICPMIRSCLRFFYPAH